MSGIFSKIISGEIPSYKIEEDDNYYAFLDIFPLVKGHALVIPKKEIDYIFDLDDDLLGGLHVFASKIAKGIEKTVECKRIGVVVLGLEVPHAHIHLIPLQSERDIDFSKPKLQFTEEEFKEIAANISTNIIL